MSGEGGGGGAGARRRWGKEGGGNGQMKHVLEAMSKPASGRRQEPIIGGSFYDRVQCSTAHYCILLAVCMTVD